MHGGLAFLMEGGFFCFYILLYACIELTKCWMGWGTLTPGWLKRHELVGWEGESEGNGTTLGDLSIRRMKHGETEPCFPRSGSM